MDPDSQIASLAPPGAVHIGEELQALRWHRLRLNLINAVAGPHGAQLMLIDTALILQVELRAPYPAEQRHQYRPFIRHCEHPIQPRARRMHFGRNGCSQRVRMREL